MRTLYLAFSLILVNNFSDNYCLGQNATRQLLEDSGTVLNNGSNGVSETQHARCHISTEELVANAETTVTRVLTGVCNAEVVDVRFRNLELTIKRELAEIKEAINSLSGCTRSTSHTDDALDPRQEEIDRLNDTVNTVNTPTGLKRTFSYFVRVKDFDQRSRWGSGRPSHNHTFHLPHPLGYGMYVRVTPGDIRMRTTYVKIGAGLTRGIHDETLDWPFHLKYQIEILDHSGQDSPRDLRASIVDPLTSGTPSHWTRPSVFGRGDNPELASMAVPAGVIIGDDRPQSNSIRHTARYLWNGDLVVKLTVHL